MSISRAVAEAKLREWTETESLLTHARAVEAVMKRAAVVYGDADSDAHPLAETYALTGLLHDADYEKWPDDHPSRIVAWLREQGAEEMAHAISAHYTKWGVPADTPLARALLACDELTGLVMACCLVRPDGIHSLTPSSVKKKVKDKAFAKGVDREEVAAGLAALDVELTAHVQFIIDALTPHAADLGIAGKGSGG